MKLLQRRAWEIAYDNPPAMIPRQENAEQPCTYSDLIQGNIDVAAKELQFGLLDDYIITRTYCESKEDGTTSIESYGVRVGDLHLKYTYT